MGREGEYCLPRYSTIQHRRRLTVSARSIKSGVTSLEDHSIPVVVCYYYLERR